MLPQKKDKFIREHIVRISVALVIVGLFTLLGMLFGSPWIGFFFGIGLGFFAFLIVHNIQKNRLKALHKNVGGENMKPRW